MLYRLSYRLTSGALKNSPEGGHTTRPFLNHFSRHLNPATHYKLLLAYTPDETDKEAHHTTDRL
jgi:hypothetical protein